MKLKLILPLALLLIGCATLNPGADPLVVRTEQALTTANATFDFILHIDQSNRSLWQTNAPAFHSFCEWLRTPTPYGTNATLTVPRAVAMELSVDDLKLAYKASKTAANSNALMSALLTLNAAILQSATWSNIVTIPTHP